VFLLVTEGADGVLRKGVDFVKYLRLAVFLQHLHIHVEKHFVDELGLRLACNMVLKSE